VSLLFLRDLAMVILLISLLVGVLLFMAATRATR
jgi:hypothetical protein